MRRMNKVLTVIGASGSSILDAAAVKAIRTALTRTGAKLGATDWLDPETACDIPFSSMTLETAEATVRAALAGAPLDFAAQSTKGRRKKLLVADMESTIIGQELIDELADVAGIGSRVAGITARSMAGELDFSASLKERAALLMGLPIATLDVVRARITLNPGARTLVQTMRAAGAYTALVSGGFTYFAETVQESCGFDESRANRLEIENDELSGQVAQPILDRDAKRVALNELAAQQNLPISATLAVGDGANDLAMVTAAGLGVAFYAKPVLRRAARVHVDHGDLTALLFLQGYRRSAFHD